MRMLMIVFLASVVGCGHSAESGNDWPCFLGPLGTSVSTEKGIISPWPKDGLKIVWHKKIGTGYSAPTISKGKLFLFDRELPDKDDPRKGKKARLTCLDSKTGKFHWKFEYPTDYKDKYNYNNGPRCCPVIDEDRVYIFGPEGMLHCVKFDDGKLVWKVDTREEFNVIQNFFGVGSTPVVEGDLLIVQVGGSPEGSNARDFAELKGNGSGVVASLRSTAHNVIAPVQSVVNDAFQPLRDVAGGITTYGSLKTENDRLRRQISDLRGQLRQIRGVGNELPQLEKLLDLPTVEDATGIVARVTAGAPGNFERTVTIDKGSNQGLRVGYPVVTGDGLVGTITQVAGRSATVILLDSPTLGVGVRLTTSNTEGITVAKAGERDLTIGFLSDPTVKAQKGELVLTSASANEAFPPDLVVGTVVGYSKPLQDLAPTITVAPAVNLDNLDFVKVLRFPDPTAAPRGG